MLFRVPQIEIRVSVQAALKNLDRLPGLIEKSIPKSLDIMGVRIMKWAYEDFAKRSDGQQASGVKWDPITRGTARGRVGRRSPYRSLVRRLKALSEEDKPLREQLRRKMRKGDRFRRQRAAIAIAFEKDNPQLKQNRAKRAAIRDKQHSLINEEHKAAKIGRDTGRLVNSLQFGKQGSVRRRVGNRIIVGTNLSYAEHFDKLRPIFGRYFFSGSRERELGELIKLQIEKVLKENGGDVI